MRRLMVVAAIASAVSWLATPIATAATDGPQIIRTDNGGRQCSPANPHRVLGYFAGDLDAFGVDPGAAKGSDATYTFEIWPAADPSTVTTLDQPTELGRLGRPQLPRDYLTDGASYAWHSRIATTSGVSPWSGTCSFTYDATAPSIPTVSSPNYPQGTWGAAGELIDFRFGNDGTADVAGFYYTWNTPGVPSCALSGAHGELVCPDPFAGPGVVRARDDGTARLLLDPPGVGPELLTVESLDRAGNVSDSVTYQVFVPSTPPRTRTVTGLRSCDGTTTFRLVPNENVHDVTAWRYQVGSENDTHELSALADGTAYLTVTTAPDTPVAVESVSADGFTSGLWTVLAFARPSVYSSDYPSRTTSGGVGVPGSFTFSSPFYSRFTTYRYQFTDGTRHDVAGDPAGISSAAHVSWTPDSSDKKVLRVVGRNADGSWSCPATYHFTVAG